MGKLNAAARNALPASQFAGPGRSYPVPDKGHAIAAKGRAAQFASPAVKAQVDAKANKVIANAGGHPSERGHVTHNEANRVPDSARHIKGSRAKMNRGKFY